jgi:hypothetical protein
MLKITGIWIATAWLGLCSDQALAQSTPAPGCFVAHFKSLAFKTHIPEQRAALAEKWLQLNAPSCSKAQLSALQANSPSWLGSALTQEIASILEGAIEANIAGNPELMARLYESSGKEVQSGSVTTTNPAARAPVVQPMANNGVIAGSANYGNISGNTTLNQNTNNLSNANSNASPANNSSGVNTSNNAVAQGGAAATNPQGRPSAPR